MGVVLAFALSLHPAPQGSFGPDKVKHFFLSAFIQSASYSALRLAEVEHNGALVGASAATLTLGIAKEVRDARAGGPFSAADLAWGLAGGAAAAVVLSQSRR